MQVAKTNPHCVAKDDNLGNYFTFAVITSLQVSPLGDFTVLLQVRKGSWCKLFILSANTNITLIVGKIVD